MQNYYERLQQVRRRSNWTYLLLVPYLVIGLVPWLKYRLPFRLMLPLPLIWMFLNFKSIRAKLLPRESESLFYKWTICAVTIFLLRFLFGLIHGQLLIPPTAAMVDVFFMILVFMVLHVSVNTGQIKELRLLALTCLISISLAALFSLRGFEDMEGGSRVLTSASSENTDISEIAFAMYKGIGSYGTIYGLGLLIAPLILLWSSVRLYMKIVIAGMVVLFFFTSLRAAFTILMVAISFSLFLIPLRLLKIRGALFNTIVGIGLFLVILSIATPTVFQFLTPVLDVLLMATDNPNYQFRISSVMESISGNTDPNNYASYRPALYWNSLDVFLTAPLTGYNGFSDPSAFNNIIGGHSFVFDTLGGFGLLGTSIYVAFYVCYIKYIKHLLQQCGYQRFSGVLSTLFFSMLLVAFLNPLWGYQIFANFLLILPGLFFFAEPRIPRRQGWMGEQPIPSPN